VRVDELLISEAVLDKLQVKHAVTLEEVEEVCLFLPAREQVWRREREGTMRLFAQTFAGRYLFVVLSNQDEGLWRVVTARDMTESERRQQRKGE
jgi:uncharacterized DUF497 family protein